MPRLDSQKQLLLNQVNNNPSVHLEQLVELIHRYEDLKVEDFKGYISELLYGQLYEAISHINVDSQWELVKRKRDLFEVADYRKNHPNSVFKYEIDNLYYELREELLEKMKAYPTGYRKEDVERLIAADIFTLYELYDQQLLTEESWEVLQQCSWEFLPFIGEYLIEDPNLRAPENCTDIYFFGSPGSGKTSLLMGLTCAKRNDYMLNLNEYGGPYAAALQQYVNAGIVPNLKPGILNFTSIINGKMFYTRKKKGILNLLLPWKKDDIDVIAQPFNLIEMSGEEFALRIADAKGVTLADMGTGATNLLKNKNKKAFFIIVDPTRLKVKVNCRFECKDSSGNVIGYDIKTKWVSQLDILNKFVTLFELEENREIMEKVDAIHFVVTKADTLGETEREREEKAKELLMGKYAGPVQDLKDYCRRSKHVNYSTNYNPLVFTFSLGKFYLGNIFDYDQTDSLRLVDALHSMIRGYRCPKGDSIKYNLYKDILW